MPQARQDWAEPTKELLEKFLHMIRCAPMMEDRENDESPGPVQRLLPHPDAAWLQLSLARRPE